MRTGTAQHDAVHRVILIGLQQRLVQFAQQLRAERVALLRPVQRDDGGLAGHFVGDLIEWHAGASLALHLCPRRLDSNDAPRREPMPELKIARVETFLFDPGTAKNLLFCRVETEDGLHGWGEAYVTAGKEPVIQQCLQAMAKHVIGRNALNIRHTGQILFDDFAIRRASLDLLSAWSALEIAMWDI